MAYNPYGAPGNPYGAPPSFNAFPGSSGAPGMAPPPGLGPPPGMSSAPGMAPPGVLQANSPAQANRPSGLPASFQPPANLPHINFNAPVIRLGASGLPPKPSTTPGPGRKDSDAPLSAGGSRPGVGADRNIEQSRAAVRESMQALQPPTREERLRTIFLHKVPASLGGDENITRFLNLVGRLRRWDSAKSNLSDHQGEIFGFAQYDDAESLCIAVELLKDVQLPVKKQEPTDSPPAVEKPETETNGDKEDEDNHETKEEESNDPYKGIEKTSLQVAVDESTIKYLESWQENLSPENTKQERLDAARTALKQAVHDLFYPQVRKTSDGDGDAKMGDGTNANGENVEVINIPLAQEDELADIPAEMREVVSQEIAAFRERSNRRDMERLKREEEMEEMERQRNGARQSRLDSPPASSNAVPLGPRGMLNAPSGPRGAGGRGGVAFVNGAHGDSREDDDTDASDDELYRRELSKQQAEDDKLYLEAERKWVNRERQRAAALERETDRERAEEDSLARRKEEQLEREKSWDDEKEASRKSHPYYRDHANWARKRAQDRADEEARDEADRRVEESERRREAAEMEHAKDMADSFLNQQAEEMEQRQAATAAAPARFTLSLGAAAQKAQARAGPQRRTVAEVEGLLDDEEQEQGAKRQLVPIKFEPIADAKAMTEEEVQNAVKSLAQEIPASQEGLWAWDVKWDYLDDSIITDKLRPFIEKKVVEYLGVQEQLLVDVVEEHLRKHAKPAELTEELEGPLEDDAVDLVKKLWRMVIFFTESEKRGLPA